MNQLNLALIPEEGIAAALRARGIFPDSVERRDYPEEIIFIVRVRQDDIKAAQEICNELDHDIQQNGLKGFITVRKSENSPPKPVGMLAAGVGDVRVNELVSLLTARSRTSEFQPSLSYIPDTASNNRTVAAPRHQLIFGRRGAGKTALMVEAKKAVLEDGNVAAWVNLQTLRQQSVPLTLVYICQRTCEAMQGFFTRTQRTPQVVVQISAMAAELDRLYASSSISAESLSRLIPNMQATLRRFAESSSCRTYIFIDELHYFPRSKQPELLDLLHGIVRDCDTWLKIAGIRHLSRWFQSNPPLGLQTGHDADPIDLDITLESPSKAKTFLEQILLSYARAVGISALSRVFMAEALDRVVLASGAVPRDYLVLSADAIRQAQRRERAKLVGVQDVNKAAGEAAKVKLAELEDDTSSSEGLSLVGELNRIRAFCLDEKRSTFFRIDFRDKEKNPSAYGVIQDLMDLRLLHLIDPSLSDEKEAGRRSEVYMIDLSQFSGQRLKKNLRALDFKEGFLVMKETGTAAPAKRGATPKQRLGILRRAPLFPLTLEINELPLK